MTLARWSASPGGRRSLGRRVFQRLVMALVAALVPFSPTAMAAELSIRHTSTEGTPARELPAMRVPYFVTDERGVEVGFESVPTRIVTLMPSLTETVCALGACDALVGTDRFSDWPARVQALPKLGGFENVPVERVFALKPDVVLAAESIRVLERLESLGIKVVAIEPRSLEDSRHAVELVAAVLDRNDEATSLLERIDDEIAAAVERVPAAWRGADVYVEISSAPYAAGETSFIGELLTVLGLDNIVPASLGPFPKLNPEFVVRADPDVIMGSRQGVDSMAGRPGWGTLSALREGRACGFEESRHDVIVRPGPRLGEAAAILADCIAGLPLPASE